MRGFLISAVLYLSSSPIVTQSSSCLRACAHCCVLPLCRPQRRWTNNVVFVVHLSWPGMHACMNTIEPASTRDCTAEFLSVTHLSRHLSLSPSLSLSLSLDLSLSSVYVSCHHCWVSWLAGDGDVCPARPACRGRPLQFRSSALHRGA